MKANETKIEDFLSSVKTQFVIPVYQRNYDWKQQQCQQLLDDIINAGKDNEINAHFIGSIVYIHDDVYSSSRVKELTIIDGQQRLITLTLIYMALYNLAKEDLKDESLESEIKETYLINKFASQNEKMKLRPTENNDKALKYLLRNDKQEEFSLFSRIIENFEYFKSQIKIENYKTVLKGLSKLMFVEVSLDRTKDNPQRIFESLNSTGLELSQADLIRNYILMGLEREQQNKIYQNYWEITENLAKDETANVSYISDFIRDYLTLKNKKIPNKDKVYNEFKEYIELKYKNSNSNYLEVLEESMQDIKCLANYYNKLINPKNEIDKDIQKQLEYINRLEINVSHPFLIKIYDDFFQSIITKSTFIDILNLIQSLVWRRFVVGLPTNSLNKIFMTLYEKVDKQNYLYSIQKSLIQKSGSHRFPKDAETIEALKLKDVYNIKPKNRIYLFDKLENYDNKELVLIDGNNDITIEHIFPQNPEIKWKQDLSADEYNEIKEKYLNTIGNLTLSGNNGKLGNKSFLSKRDLIDVGYKDSRLWLNKFMSNIDKWSINEIEKRFNIISERFLKIWQYPSILDVKETENEINIFEAEDPTSKKLEYAVFLNKKIKVKEVSKLYVEIFKKLFELQPEAFFNSDIGTKIGLTTKAKASRVPVAINETYFIDTNFDNKGKFNRIKQALEIFKLEDELIIKYAGIDKTSNKK